MGFFDKSGSASNLVPREVGEYYRLSDLGEGVLLKPNQLQGLEYDVLKGIKSCHPHATANDVKGEITKPGVTVIQVQHIIDVLKSKGLVARIN
jgi:hypothetical protein